jgi:hypothetical protein
VNRSTGGLGRWLVALGFGFGSVMGTVLAQAQQLCGGTAYPFPYTDVASVGAAFCPGIMEAYVTGISKGTTPTTFSPTETVTRVQMTTFLQRSVDQVLTRGSRRGALNQWWTPIVPQSMQTIALGGTLVNCAADGADIWVSDAEGGAEYQVQANTGKLLGTWGGLVHANGVVVATGKVFVTGISPGNLYVIDPTQAPGAVAPAATLGVVPGHIAFDGIYLWTANQGSPGSVSIMLPYAPYDVLTVTTGFSSPRGILYDGANIWVTDYTASTLLRLEVFGTILQTVTVGMGPEQPAFDGENIWVPNSGGNSITVVQASTGNAVATISADATNLLSNPTAATFDGERILITNQGNASVTVFKAADLSFIANVSTGTGTEPFDPCSDGTNFWIPLQGGTLMRF